MPSDPGPSLVQDQLETVGGRILDAVEAGGYSGFTGLSADADNARLLLCWLHDEPLPGPIADIVANPGEPVEVVRQHGDYTQADLDSRVDLVLADPGLEVSIEGTIHTVTVPEEGTGLIAGVQPYDPSVDPAAFAAQAEPILSAAAGVPVTVVVENEPEFAARRLDASPWYGGARLTDGAGQCTSGFGMLRGSTPYLLTAFHCFAPLAAVFTGPPPVAPARRIGTVRMSIPPIDSEAIEIAAPGQAGSFVYTGGVGVGEGTARIAGPGRNIAGLAVCNSGSFSGELCGIAIARVRVIFVEPIRGVRIRIGPMVWGRTMVPGGIANAKGNSGGPIIRYTASPGRVLAMGTDSASITGFFGCVLFDARVCASDVVYADINTILRSYGGVLS